MRLTPLDSARLREALALAEHSIGLSDPNPRVGCVIGGEDGAMLGRGFTQEAGGPHAEIVALRDAQAAGCDVRGATAWVTLEPCAHHGRTPPCCDALVEAGIERVVVAVGDPNPLVAGAGLARLRAAGIVVVMGDEEIADAARELNIGFFSRMERGRPWLRMKVAISLDGRTALENGVSQWITGEAARADGHGWRRRSNAVLTGIGTVLQDDPRLDVRLVETTIQPLRVIVDSKLQLTPKAKVLQPPGRALVYTTVPDTARHSALVDLGAEVRPQPSTGGKVDLVAMLSDLASQGTNELHVEAGERLNASLLRTGMVDELLVYVAPLLLGAGSGLADLGTLEQLSDGIRLRFHDVCRIGPDLRLRLRPLGDLGR